MADLSRAAHSETSARSLSTSIIKEIQGKVLLSHCKNPDGWFGVKYNMNIYRGCEHHWLCWIQIAELLRMQCRYTTFSPFSTPNSAVTSKRSMISRLRLKLVA